MRGFIKKQILTMIDTMDEANHLLEQLQKKGDENRTLQILAEEQQAAIQIGELIESTHEQNLEPVSALENYCDLLWKCSTETGKERKFTIRKLQSNCIKIKDKIRKEIEAQYEIVFLPYKASMWDSLESVWLEAKEDKTCNCYVIPIPYYDRRPDRSLGKVYYEGERFPDYVQITSWKEYDLVSRHPEAIFIHNPYDEFNLVTSIHPQYYSTELKKATDMLVYIPYFVSEGDTPEQFCKTQGVFNADRVVVRSERERDIYIKAMQQSFHLTDAQAKTALYDKFLPFGSPKVDKVLNAKRETVTVPVEWERKLLFDTEAKA